MAKRRSNTFWAVVILGAVLGTLYITGNPMVTGFINSIFGGQTQFGDGDEVKFSVQVKESLGAFSSEDIIVNAYDVNGNYLGSATASSGVATFTFLIEEGSSVYLQGRQGDVASADGYVTPATHFIVGDGDPADTVAAFDAVTGQNILWVDNLHDSTEPVATFRAPDGANISAYASADNLTSGDTYFTFNLRMSEDDCWYGAPDFTDMQANQAYAGGIWLVLASDTDSYSFENSGARTHISWYEDGSYYYAWNFDNRLWQSSTLTSDNNEITYTITVANGDDFDKGSSKFTLDVFDMKKITSSPQYADFVDGGALAPTQHTAYVD